MSQLTEASDRERELLQQNRTLQDDLNGARSELDRCHSNSRQEESRLAEERDALRERLEDARRDQKMSEEALAQTVFQYNGQLSALKAECSVISAKLEHERQTRQQLEAEAEASRVRLQGALQEAERCQVRVQNLSFVYFEAQKGKIGAWCLYLFWYLTDLIVIC